MCHGIIFYQKMRGNASPSLLFVVFPCFFGNRESANLRIETADRLSKLLLIKNKTVIIISRRLKSVENINKLVVIDESKAESSGMHKALMKSSNIYNNLVRNVKSAVEYTYLANKLAAVTAPSTSPSLPFITKSAL